MKSSFRDKIWEQFVLLNISIGSARDSDAVIDSMKICEDEILILFSNKIDEKISKYYNQHWIALRALNELKSDINKK
jgi:hypothetical protein